MSCNSNMTSTTTDERCVSSDTPTALKMTDVAEQHSASEERVNGLVDVAAADNAGDQVERDDASE